MHSFAYLLQILILYFATNLTKGGWCSMVFNDFQWCIWSPNEFWVLSTNLFDFETRWFETSLTYWYILLKLFVILFGNFIETLWFNLFFPPLILLLKSGPCDRLLPMCFSQRDRFGRMPDTVRSLQCGLRQRVQAKNGQPLSRCLVISAFSYRFFLIFI